jgi:hypothetical protein
MMMENIFSDRKLFNSSRSAKSFTTERVVSQKTLINDEDKFDTMDSVINNEDKSSLVPLHLQDLSYPFDIMEVDKLPDFNDEIVKCDRITEWGEKYRSESISSSSGEKFHKQHGAHDEFLCTQINPCKKPSHLNGRSMRLSRGPSLRRIFSSLNLMLLGSLLLVR